MLSSQMPSSQTASSRIGYRTRLYRKSALAVIFAAALLVPAFAQYAKKRQVSKGPRAVGLLELAGNGKAHLIAVSIMIDGKFYDAGAYKANPVPMALQPDTVYEAVKSGAPQGLFTVSGAMANKGSWVADGKWRSQADIEADKARAKAEAAKKAYKAPEDPGGPPKLRRPANSASDSSSSQTQPASSAPSTKDQTAPASGSGSNSKPPAEEKPSQNEPSKTQPAANSSKNTPETSSTSVEAPDRPILRRQVPSETTREQTTAGNEVEPLTGPIQLIPAVSDSGGPEARPYTYELKPDEQQKFLKSMLAMASNEVERRAAHLLGASETAPAAPAKGRSKPATKVPAKGPAPEFQDVQLKIFDLTNSNEPVLVLTANASIPNSKLNLRYSVALIAREDIYAELHKIFAQATDDQHLDVLPKYEFVDAVDADGDGRGELLFRTTSASGQAFNIYAVIGDRLWPLFEGKPAS